MHIGCYMAITYKKNLKEINWEDLLSLFQAAPLGNITIEGIKVTFTNSLFNCFAFDGKKLVGVGRALADGHDCSYICDIAVLPEYQGGGIGKCIVQTLIASSCGHKKIILYSNPGVEGFYHTLGFRRMNTAMAIFENEQDELARGVIS